MPRKNIFLDFFVIFLLCYSGCAVKDKQPTVTTIIHSETWLTGHKTEYLSFKTACTDCHGSDGSGGNAHVSCFSAAYKGISCHEQHPAGWTDFTSHGAAAQYDTASYAFPKLYGFPNCQKCHGDNFKGGIVNVSCFSGYLSGGGLFSCHGVNAPHPRAPWNDTTDTTRPRTRHHHRDDPLLKSNAGNLAVCFGCHANGRYSRKKPDTTKAAGTELGCLNNSICHPGPKPTD